MSSTDTNLYDCFGCGRKYSTAGALQKHCKSSLVCAKWSQYSRESRDFPQIFDVIQDNKVTFNDVVKSIIPASSGGNKCKYCDKSFLSGSALAKHMRSSLVCDKWRLHELLMNAQRVLSGVETRKVDIQSSQLLKEAPIDKGSGDIEVLTKQYEPFDAPAYQITHIIWNVFLIDKDFIKKQDLQAVCVENKVTYIIGIVPDHQTFGAAVDFDIATSIMIYHGHDTVLDTQRFDEECARIEAKRKLREYVMVFCNSGYQRSIPFLCYYLCKFHKDEVPGIAQAIDIILPQVDKAGYAENRYKLIASISKLFFDNQIAI